MSELDDINDYRFLADKLKKLDRTNAPSPTSPRALKQRIDQLQQQNESILNNLKRLEAQMQQWQKSQTSREDYLAIRKMVNSLKVSIDDKAEEQTLTDLRHYVRTLPTFDKILSMSAGVIVLVIALLALGAHYHLLS